MATVDLFDRITVEPGKCGRVRLVTMIADFKGELTSGGQIKVPPEIAAQVPNGEHLQVTLQWGIEQDEWRNAGRLRFEAVCSPEDDIYDALIHDNLTR